MIPYLLAAIGGYLIGESTNSKLLNNAANGSVADAGLEVASASMFEKGGLVEMLPADKLIKILKEVDFKSFDSSEIESVEYSTLKMNPFDTYFAGEIFAYPSIIQIRKNDDGYTIQIGKDTGWTGGLEFDRIEYSFDVKSITIDNFEKGLKKAVKDNIVTLYSRDDWDDKLKIYFVGKEKDAEKFAKSKGYKKRYPFNNDTPKKKASFQYYYRNDSLPIKSLSIRRFSEKEISDYEAGLLG
jgi:hypothetical protein